MRMMKRLPVAPASVVALALAGCSGGTGDAEDTQPASGVAAASGSASEVTPEYLAGQWCYVKYEAGDETSEENINYEFSTDGSLKYQTNSSTPVDMPGSYEFKDGALVVKPALALFKQKPVKVAHDAMETEAMGGRMFWSRGPCGG